MTKLNGALSLILVLVFIATTEAVAPIFLQAITSALATIPFTGGPMTTGLIGAKLGIGTKLLYYLGYFGRGSRKTPIPKQSPRPAKATAAPKLPGGLQPLPLPYILSGAGRFQQMGGGFGGPANFQQIPFGGFEPSQVFQALRSQGYDANTAMQIMNYGAGFGMGGGGGGFGMNAGGPGMNLGGGGFGMNTGGSSMNLGGDGGFGQSIPNFPPNMGGGGFGQNVAGFLNDIGGGFTSDFPDDAPQGFPSNPTEIADAEDGANLGMGGVQPPSDTEGVNPDEIESFFTFLQDMDDNGCISRLICDIGADPSFLGDFSENIHGIVGSLDVEPSSRAYPYMQIMESGKEGGCSAKFPQCSDSAYGVVKSIAPTVGVPQNINAEAVNRL